MSGYEFDSCRPKTSCRSSSNVCISTQIHTCSNEPEGMPGSYQGRITGEGRGGPGVGGGSGGTAPRNLLF